MRAIILNAGQGRRLLPLTLDRPKCLLSIHGSTILERQLLALAAAGVEEVAIVTGFAATSVDAEVERCRPPSLAVTTIVNPLYDRTDNLVSCLSARAMMDQPFLLLNGDTLFQPGVVARLLDSPAADVAIAVSCKEGYDADDMKVQWRGGRILRVGKDLPSDIVDGEAIGVSLFRGRGPGMFVAALEEVAARPDGRARWYLSAVDAMASRGQVAGVGIGELRWIEIDTPEDLRRAREVMPLWSEVPPVLLEPTGAELETV